MGRGRRCAAPAAYSHSFALLPSRRLPPPPPVLAKGRYSHPFFPTPRGEQLQILACILRSAEPVAGAISSGQYNRDVKRMTTM